MAPSPTRATAAGGPEGAAPGCGPVGGGARGPCFGGVSPTCPGDWPGGWAAGGAELVPAATGGGTVRSLRQYRHLMASSWIISAQYGHFFTFDSSSVVRPPQSLSATRRPSPERRPARF